MFAENIWPKGTMNLTGRDLQEKKRSAGEVIHCAAAYTWSEKLRLAGRRVTNDLCGEGTELEMITLH